jgi:DNA-binding response OmpR family regulator
MRISRIVLWSAAALAVVMLTTSDDPDDIRQAYLLGASSYFTKPQDHQSLRELLKKIHEYWAECEVPEVDEAGYAVTTDSRAKAGVTGDLAGSLAGLQLRGRAPAFTGRCAWTRDLRSQTG